MTDPDLMVELEVIEELHKLADSGNLPARLVLARIEQVGLDGWRAEMQPVIEAFGRVVARLIAAGLIPRRRGGEDTDS